MKQRSFLIIFTAFHVFFTCLVGIQGKASSGTSVSGIINQNTTWTAEGSPYFLAGDIQIANGVKLTIEPGTTIEGNNKRIRVFGDFEAVGNSESKIKFNNVDIEPGAGDYTKRFLIHIEYADINYGSLYRPGPGAIYGSLILRDSRLSNLSSYLYLWYPTNDVNIERNVFISSEGISVGTSDNVKVNILNNVFYNYKNFAVENWASYSNSETIVSYNSFLNRKDYTGYALVLPAGYSSSKMTAMNNYWGATNEAAIERMIFDKNDDLSSASYINFKPYLLSPDQNTPDIIPPNVPSVNEITDKSTSITGTSEPGSTITVKSETGVIGTTVTQDDMTFLVPINLQKAGTTLMVTATDYAGNVSEGKEVTVKDVTAPFIQTINEVTDKSTSVNGISEMGSTINVNAGTLPIGTALTHEDGSFTVPINLQKAGTTLTITASDNAGNVSDPKEVTVKDVTFPIIEGVTNDSLYNRDVTIFFNEGTATLNGENYELGTLIKDEGFYTLVVTDETGNQTTVKFIIDKTPPHVFGVENDVIYNNDVTPLFGDGTATLNGLAYTSGTVVKDERTYTLVVTDPAGNKTTVRFTIDKTAPVVSGVINNAYYNKEVTPVFNEGTATLNGATFASGQTVKEEGSYTLVVTDKAGNKTTVQFIIDKTAPVISGVATDGIYNEEVTPTFNEGTATLNGSAFTSGTTIKMDGSYTLVVTDKAGNKTTIKFTVDKTPPVVEGVVNDSLFNKAVTVTFTEGTAELNGESFNSGTLIEKDGNYTLVVTDTAGNITTIKFIIDTTGPIVTGVTDNTLYNKDVTPVFNEGTATLNGAAFTSGTKVTAAGTYSLVVTDKAGNATTVKFTIDKTAPKVTGVTNNAYYNKDVKITFEEGTATLNGAALTSGSVVKTPGVYTLVVTDLAGNKTTLKFTIDKTAPKVTGVTNNAFYNKDVKVTFNEGKATLNGVTFVSGTVVKTAKVYTLVVTDAAGNKTTVKFTIDKTAPKVTGVANNAFYNKDVRVYFNEGKATLNGVAFKSGTVVKPAKAYTLVVTDSAGNKTTIKFTIDKTPPAAPRVNTVKSGARTVTGIAEAYSVVTIKVGTKVIGKVTTDRYGKYKVTIPAQKRNTALYVNAKDRAGNVSKVTKTTVK
ncbi:Ig-like domain-containing protein [Bacillus sp. EB01]|uniref:Ig-like domain-containing protein n=1 Tax=Bacillus sp. EB01 TaxID=1347086 RepID=UPI0005C4C33C|nr:Ig-like domain-containing protein [Bacillus sp. EB01]